MEVVEFLIQSKADVHAVDRWGGVPLKDAIRGKHKDVQQILRKAGAKSWVPTRDKSFKKVRFRV